MIKRTFLIALLALLGTTWTPVDVVELIGKAMPLSAFTSSTIVDAPVPFRLTSGACCTQPFWSPDGKQVRYIDKPSGGKLGIYAVTVEESEGGSILVSERVEDSRIVGPYRIETTRTATTLVRLSDGAKFSVPAQGRSVQFSPDFSRIAWSISNDDLSPEQQVAAIWVANVDGSSARRVGSLRRGGLGGWVDANTLLVNGQVQQGTREQVLWAMTIADGKLREIARAERLRSAVLSPSGRWIVYYTTFQDDASNGLWLVDTQGGKPRALPKETFGAYQWRARAAGGDRLLIVPFRPSAQYHEFWQLEPQTLAFMQLTKAETAPIKIANGDWRVSPDGRYVTYVESKDRNIWALELP
jgi:Tol biopolymer transport system component